MKKILMGLAVAGAAMLGGCAVYPTPYGPAVAPAPIAVAPAPVYVGPPAVVVRPYGGYYGYYGRRYYHW
ncbi:hypothetical protein ACUXAV_004575 [Cupriavidus metallidurans]|jgi:hypothetical protein|uniref:Lipoprotein n=2 Tax=Cupriavidus metallidurans TaxID=119219 RepID=Q1LIE8_CUPMC|nr:conserved hypothetical protein; putative exported protein [Cupriavidus metallidurans CH34]